jgi:hypothetical protein
MQKRVDAPPVWRAWAGMISLLLMVITIACFEGLQTASTSQVIAFSTACALSLVLTLVAIRRGGTVNTVAACFTVIGQLSIFYLLFIF